MKLRFLNLWDFVLKSQKSFLQRRVPIKRTLCKDFWNEQFNVLFCRFRYPAKDRHQYSNVSSGLFLPHYHCSFEVVKVKEVTTCTFSKALVNEKAVGIQILYLVQPIALERIRKVLRREYRVMIFGKKCWFILRAVDAQLFRETIAHRPNIIEMFLDGDVLIEILCKCQIYSETIADRKNIIETFLGGDILIGY